MGFFRAIEVLDHKLSFKKQKACRRQNVHEVSFFCGLASSTLTSRLMAILLSLGVHSTKGRTSRIDSLHTAYISLYLPRQQKIL